MEPEVDVSGPGFVVVQAEDSSFALMDLSDLSTRPISKAGMLLLAQSLDGWFKKIAELK